MKAKLKNKRKGRQEVPPSEPFNQQVFRIGPEVEMEGGDHPADNDPGEHGGEDA